MKKFVVALLVLVLALSGTIGFAEEEQKAKFLNAVGNVMEIKSIAKTIGERINEFNTRIDDGEKLTKVEVLTYISYIKAYTVLKEIEATEINSYQDEITDALVESRSSLQDIVDSMCGEEDLLIDGTFDSDFIAGVLREYANGVGEE